MCTQCIGFLRWYGIHRTRRQSISFVVGLVAQHLSSIIFRLHARPTATRQGKGGQGVEGAAAADAHTVADTASDHAAANATTSAAAAANATNEAIVSGALLFKISSVFKIDSVYRTRDSPAPPRALSRLSFF